MTVFFCMSPAFDATREALFLGRMTEAIGLLDALQSSPLAEVELVEAEHLRFLVYFYSGHSEEVQLLLRDMQARWADSDDPLVRFHVELCLACWDLIVDFPSAHRRITALVAAAPQVSGCAHPLWASRLRGWLGVAEAFNGRFALGCELAAAGCFELEDLHVKASPAERSGLFHALVEVRTFAYICAVIRGDLDLAISHRQAAALLQAERPFRFFHIHALSVSLRQAFRQRDLASFEAIDRLLQDAHTAGGLAIDERYTLSLASLLAVISYESGHPELGQSYWSQAEDLAAKISYGVSGAHFFQASATIAAMCGDFDRALAAMASAQPLLEAAGRRSHQALEGQLLTFTIQAAAIIHGPATLRSKSRQLAALDADIQGLEAAAAEALLLWGQVRALRLVLLAQEEDELPDVAFARIARSLHADSRSRSCENLATLWAAEARRLTALIHRHNQGGGWTRTVPDSRSLHLIDDFARQMAAADIDSLPAAFAAIHRFFTEAIGISRVALITIGDDGAITVLQGDDPLALRQRPAATRAQLLQAEHGLSCHLTAPADELYTALRVPALEDATFLLLEGGQVNPCFNHSLLNIVRLAASVTGLLMRGHAAEKTLRDQATLVAIGRTMQMLAHDVRKPFTLMRMGLGMLQRARDSEAVLAVRSRLVPEIEKAMASVDGMISDVMSIGGQGGATCREVVSFPALIASALTDIFRIRPAAEVKLDYRLSHTGSLHIEVARTSRMLTNIIDNAVQAMNEVGVLTLRTQDVRGDGGYLIEVQIHNTGSFIAEADLPRLFEPFYTKGKRNGTGLGLAIAHKVVTEQGGDIWCRSDAVSGTTFGFTLPAVLETPSEAAVTLPAHSRDFRTRSLLAKADGPALSYDSPEA